MAMVTPLVFAFCTHIFDCEVKLRFYTSPVKGHYLTYDKQCVNFNARIGICVLFYLYFDIKHVHVAHIITKPVRKTHAAPHTPVYLCAVEFAPSAMDVIKHYGLKQE